MSTISLLVPVFYFILFIGAVNYFIPPILFEKLLGKHKTNQTLNWLLRILVSVLVYLGSVFAFLFLIFYEPTYDFDKKDWDSDIENRWRMADDIVESKMLIGKDTTGVKLLIGNPSINGYFENGKLRWHYDLGMSGHGLGWCYNNMFLTFNENKVEKVDYYKSPD